MDRTITIYGKGKASVRPDQIEISISLESQDKKYWESIKNATAQLSELKEAFSDLGFGEGDIRTGSFRVYPEYESIQDSSGHWVERFRFYNTRQEINVKFPNDGEMLGRVIGRLARLSSTPRFDIGYTVKDHDAVKKELIRSAVKDAMEKAEIICEAAGIGLGDIARIDYSQGNQDFFTRPVGFMMAKSRNAYAEEADTAMGIDAEPEDIQIEDEIQIVFNILRTEDLV